ncbi:MAG: hypothetical protein GY749_03880, partial [Desulfobacteraceae bacterium]|nr:hypothetical protein [Desulfobacteraceae bacterium]
LERLEALPDGLLSYRLKNRWRDGTTHILMERRELLERLAPLIPPPRAHQVRYHGILAPCAAGRSFVVPGAAAATAAAPREEPVKGVKTGASIGAGATGAPGLAAASSDVPRTRSAAAMGKSLAPVVSASAPRGGSTAPDAPSSSALRRPAREAPRVRTASSSRPRRLSWSELLKRVFGLDALRCPMCGDTMRVMAVITDPGAARRILACLKLPPRAPPLARAPSTPVAVPDLFEDSCQPEVEPSPLEFDFDQRPRFAGADDDEGL